MIIHHATSIGVCQSLSFNGNLSSLFKLHNNAELKLERISLIHFACLPDSNLIFIASYATNNEKAKETANSTLLNHSLNRTIVVTLVANPEWNDGNPHAAKILVKLNSFILIESIITFNTWIENQTTPSIKIGFRLIPHEKYWEILCHINSNITKRHQINI